jgi:hypothetical protein
MLQVRQGRRLSVSHRSRCEYAFQSSPSTTRVGRGLLLKVELTRLQLSRDLQKWFCAPTATLKNVRSRLEDLVHDMSANELGVLKVISRFQLCRCRAPCCSVS